MISSSIQLCRVHRTYKAFNWELHSLLEILHSPWELSVRGNLIQGGLEWRYKTRTFVGMSIVSHLVHPCWKHWRTVRWRYLSEYVKQYRIPSDECCRHWHTGLLSPEELADALAEMSCVMGFCFLWIHFEDLLAQEFRYCYFQDCCEMTVLLDLLKIFVIRFS
jgi:hypothetical protein